MRDGIDLLKAYRLFYCCRLQPAAQPLIVMERAILWQVNLVCNQVNQKPERFHEGHMLPIQPSLVRDAQVPFSRNLRMEQWQKNKHK